MSLVGILRTWPRDANGEGGTEHTATGRGDTDSVKTPKAMTEEGPISLDEVDRMGLVVVANISLLSATH